MQHMKLLDSLRIKKLHELIDTLNPDLRVSKNREFFVMSPEKAYRLLEAIAIISGSEDKLQCVAPNKEAQPKDYSSDYHRKQREQIDFFKCGIPIGAELMYVDDDSIHVTVVDNKNVKYKGEITRLSPLAAKLRGCTAIQGASVFTYNGRKIVDIAEETQWNQDAITK